MCGIAGIFSKASPVCASVLAPSLQAMRHRGPDDEGVLVIDSDSGAAFPLGGDDTPMELGLRHWREAEDVRGRVILGHRRLSILDLSPRGHQPMQSADGKCWITFNGEIYNYVELREELRALGHEFKTGTDTEVILHSWQQWGKTCLSRFNGDWAFCIADLRKAEPELFLARDRYGIKPLFFADTSEAFWFASEAKCLVGHAVPFKPREQAVVRFLFGGELPAGDGPDTFFEGIEQLPPGHAISITAAGREQVPWYNLRRASRKIEAPDERAAVGQMVQQVHEAVRLRLRADVPVGSCLSGGVDSSSIVGTMRNLLDAGQAGELHTFSAVYKTKGNYNESEWIKQAVSHSRSQPHYTFPDEAPLEEMFDRMVWHQDEPFQTASIFAQWCVMKEARTQGVTVLLDGQAADELLGGYQPGTCQERFLEWISGGKWMVFFREWVLRKFATRLSWLAVIRELCQMLVRGATGALWVDKERFHFAWLADETALKPEVIESFFDSSPAVTLEDAKQDRAATLSKLAQNGQKLSSWTERLEYVRNKRKSCERSLKTRGPVPAVAGCGALEIESGQPSKKKTLHDWLDEERRLLKKLAAKKRHIADNRQKLRFLNKQINSIEADAMSGCRLGNAAISMPMRARWTAAINRIHGSPRHNLRDYLLTQTSKTSLPHLLRFEDRNSMAFSIEARVPFTDHRLVEWCFSHANELKIHRGWTKWVLREAMAGRAPASLLWRRDKTGFETPDITMARRVIEHRKKSPDQSEFLLKYLDAEKMKRVTARLENGKATRDDARLVWRWLVLDSWHEQFTKAGSQFASSAAGDRAAAEQPQSPVTETPAVGSKHLAGMPAKPPDKKRICIVAFSPCAEDARVLRQARSLSEHYQVTLAGFGPSPFAASNSTNIEWFELDLDDSHRVISLSKQAWRLRLSGLFPRMLEDYLFEFGHYRHAWHLIQARNFDLIYCNDIDTVPLGVVANRDDPKCKFILDLHEYPTREMESKSGDEAREWRRVRKPLVTGLMRHYAPKAHGAVTVTSTFVPLFQREFGIEPLVVCNAPDYCELPPARPAEDGKIHLIHHGGCLPLRKLEDMIYLTGMLDERFVLHMMLTLGPPDYLEFLKREAAKLRPGRVVFEPPVAPEDIAATISRYDIGIFLLQPDVFNYEHALPNKFFDFIAAGLGVAIGPSPGMAVITREHGLGWISDDFELDTFAAMLNQLTAEEIAQKRAAADKARRVLNAGVEMGKLRGLVHQVLHGKPLEKEAPASLD